MVKIQTVIKLLIYTGIFLLINFCANAQHQDSIKHKRYTVSFAPGISHQDFAFENHFSPKPGAVQSSILFDDGNAKGWGIPIPISIYDNTIGLGLKFNPVLRYTVIHRNPFSPQGEDDGWAFFADYHFSIYRNINIRKGFLKKLFRGQPLYAGLGYSFVSPGLSYKQDYTILFKEPYQPRVIEGEVVYLDFQGFHVYLGIPVYKKVYFETLFMYVPEGQILYKAYWESSMLMFSVKYNLDIRFSSKK